MLQFFLKLFCFFVVFAFSHLQAQNMLKSDLLVDLRFLDSAYQFGHPVNLIQGQHLNFASSINRVTQFLPDKLDKIQYENAVREVLMDVKCGHTNIVKWSQSTPKKDIPKKLFPHRVFTDGEKIWITEKVNDSVQSNLQRGDEIIAINGHKMDSVLVILKNFHPQDGEGSDLSKQMVNELFPGMYAKCIDRDSAFHVTYRNRTGTIHETTVHGCEFKPREETDLEEDVLGNNAYMSLLHDSIAYLRIKSIESKEQEFYDRVFQRIEDRQINYLIIDLRNNTGGSLFSSADLISYFTPDTCSFTITFPKHNLRPFLSWKYQRRSRINNFRWKHYKKFEHEKTASGTKFTSYIYPKERLNFEGEIYVLTNGYTSSGASFITSYARNYGNAIVVGQKTGGGEFWNSAGTYPLLTLPKSGIQIQTATTYLQTDFSAKHHNNIHPDFQIKYDADSYGVRDLEMETVFELIGNK